MTRTLVFQTWLCVVAAWAGFAFAEAPDRPNIILVFTDDQGYADLGIHGTNPDVRTPHLDQLARDGALFTNGYVTAPQCIPSRAGLVAGRHQNAFGLDDNHRGPLSHEEYTIAERVRDAGYVTGMIGKWHLEIGYDEDRRVYFDRESLPDRHGFTEMFMGYMQEYHATFDLEGRDVQDGYQRVRDPHYRIDIQTRSTLAFLDRRKQDDRPFFLLLGYFAPHSPIEGPPQYMARLQHVQPEIRRMALASVLAMDDGIGMIRQKLQEMGLTENTLIFYISDNGAPLIEGGYIGSLNTPLIGEKGMQTDGGQRVPFIAAWPGTIPAGQVIDQAVWALDASATVVSVANAPVDERIEGVNLMPWLTGQRTGPLHDALYWRWRSQSAILSDGWKFVRLGNERRYLFDMRTPGRERAQDNQIEDHPEIAAALERKLMAKADTWATPGLPEEVVGADRRFFDMHVDSRLPPPPMEDGKTCAFIGWDDTRPQTKPDAPAAVWHAATQPAPGVDEARMQGWFVRQGRAEPTTDGIRIVSNRPHTRTFFGRAFAERLTAPLIVELEARAAESTTLRLMWLGASGRQESDFAIEPKAELRVAGEMNWTTVRTTVDTAEPIAILRVLLEGHGEIPVELRRIRLIKPDGSAHEYNFDR